MEFLWRTIGGYGNYFSRERAAAPLKDIGIESKKMKQEEIDELINRDTFQEWGSVNLHPWVKDNRC